ncbi:XkdQ/YqbQ family protein [Longirhabdus pacifica]|uniref:XkdQ/YqbQ family protein n=1 Tax=Longirhabdus pacifica TaxID=2305227 RepID=UPI0010086DC5|nr:hypothetical protein [Longirhabdus pacifica]
MLRWIYDRDIYLDPVVMSTTWSGDTKQAFRVLELKISNTEDGKTPVLNIEKGKALQFMYDDEEVFRGVIFQHHLDIDGIMRITAYDENVYLTKNMDSKKFNNKTASAIIKSLCNEFAIPIGEITDTGYVISKIILRDKTLWNMMNTALMETEKHTGKKYYIYAAQGQLNLRERKENKAEDWVLENGFNILKASHSASIEDLRNQVKVVSGDQDKNPVSKTVKNDDAISAYGLMQHLESTDGNKSSSDVEQLAKQLLQQYDLVKEEVDVEALGAVNVTAGTTVQVKESMTQLDGAFTVITDSHTFENQTHTMRLTLDKLS